MTHPAGGRLASLLHHFAVALAFASVLFVLEHAGMLNWLDSLSLRIVSSLHHDGIFAQMDAAPLPDDPVVVAISPALYETEFGQRSPLDRARLATIIAPLLAARPAILVVDIDLSPGGLDDPAAQAALDAVLARAVAQGTPVLLGAPVPVASDALLERKYAWMKSLCASGVSFGFPVVPMTQGITLRMTRAPFSIAEQARNLLAKNGASAQAPGSPCALVGQGIASAAFLSRDMPLATGGQHAIAQQQPIRIDLLARLYRGQVVLASSGDVASLPSLAGRVVFLGGNFDAQDQFTTVIGPTSGLVIHAASFVALGSPTTNVRPVWAFLIDLVIGTVAGFVFHATWTRYNAAALRLRRQERALWSGYLAARAWMLGNVLGLVLILVLVFSWSGWLLRHDLWNNPGPMLIGIFIKMAVASRITLVEDLDIGARADGHRMPAIALVDSLAWLPFVCLALYYLLASGH